MDNGQCLNSSLNWATKQRWPFCNCVGARCSYGADHEAPEVWLLIEVRLRAPSNYISLKTHGGTFRRDFSSLVALQIHFPCKHIRNWRAPNNHKRRLRRTRRAWPSAPPAYASACSSNVTSTLSEWNRFLQVVTEIGVFKCFRNHLSVTFKSKHRARQNWTKALHHRTKFHELPYIWVASTANIRFF